MAKRTCKPTAESAVKRDLRTDKYRIRVVQSKVAYRRKPKHKNGQEPFLKQAA